MIEIRKILCPVDFSECSRHALDHAVAVARWYESAVTVFHVLAPAAVTAYPPGIAGFPAPLSTLENREDVLAGMERFVAAHAHAGVRVDILTEAGDPAPAIVTQANDMAADLLVMGTHGRSGFERLLLGSVTEKVLRRAGCPVMSVPPRVPDVPASRPVVYKRMLCPVDFSESAMEALRYASSLAQEADARLTVLHVMEYGTHEWPELYETFMTHERVSVLEFRKRCEALSRERLDLAVSDDVRRYCTVETVLAEGKPYRETLRVAAEQQADLIIMGVRGRRPLDLLMFGSTTQHVVRLAACPVLTLRGK